MALRLIFAFMTLNACLILGACRLPQSSPDFDQITEQIRSWTKERDLSPAEKVHVAPIAGNPSVIVARLEYQQDWWGCFSCFEFKDGKIACQAMIDDRPSEQSIYSVKGFCDPSFEGPLIEVIGRTHMGNGYLYLYELGGGRLRLLLKTRAYDTCRHDRWTFRDGVLNVNYHSQRDGEGIEVELTGIVNEFPEASDLDAPPTTSFPYRKVFVWHRGEQRFIQDSTRCLGFEHYYIDD